MPVTGSTRLPIGPRNREWNGSDARRRIVDFYTKDGTTNWTQVKKAFFWVDPGKEDLKTGYNLGFADVVDGTVKAIPRGLFAVAGGHGVQRIRAPSSSEKNAIKRKVNTYYRRMKAAFPNDDFDFDPPFPEVKEDDHMEVENGNKIVGYINDKGEYITTMERGDEPIDVLESDPSEELWEEVKQKFFPGGTFATSFADLAAVEAVRRAIQKAFKTVYDFEMLAHGIAREAETPAQLVTGLKALTKEMSAIFEEMTFEEEDKASENDKGLTTFLNTDIDGKDWEIKQSETTALLKNEKGDQFFYGRFTNNLWDKDGEVLISKAHQDFVDYLDSNPDEAPELWDWHEEDTAKSHKAVWWDYADGFLHCIWPVTDKEATGIVAFMEEFEPGMSHGFKVLKRMKEDKNQIAQYRTFEASILPIEFAANEWTTFDVLQAAKEKTVEERYKMFSPEKQRALALLSLGEYKNPLGKASEEDAAEIDEAGVQRKDQKSTEGSDQMEDQDVKNKKDQEEEEVSTQEEEESTTKTEALTDTTLETLQASIVEGFSLLTERLEAMKAQVDSNTEALKGIKEKKGESPSVAAWVAAQKAGTSIQQADNGKKDTDSLEDDPLFGTGPEEEPFQTDGHLLASL